MAEQADKFQRIRSGLQRLGALDSPFVPQSAAEYNQHCTEMIEQKTDALRVKIKAAERLSADEKNAAASPEARVGLDPPFRNKRICDFRTPVLARPSIWGPQAITEEPAGGGWPSIVELKVHGDAAVADGRERSLPLPPSFTAHQLVGGVIDATAGFYTASVSNKTMAVGQNPVPPASLLPVARHPYDMTTPEEREKESKEEEDACEISEYEVSDGLADLLNRIGSPLPKEREEGDHCNR